MNSLFRFASLAFTTLLLIACSGGSSSSDGGFTSDGGPNPRRDGEAADVHKAMPDVFVASRMGGARTPLSAECDPVDGTRCLLPWPSNTFTVVDKTSATGLRLALSSKAVAMTDDPTSVNRADGFSRVTPIETGFDGTLDPSTFGDRTTGGVRLIVEQPGPNLGASIPLRFDMVTNGDATNPQSLLLAYPRVPLNPATDYAVVVLDTIHLTGGTPLKADRNAQVALGLAAPLTSYEGELYAYDAPARTAMSAAGIEPTQAVRVWDFTTRSLMQPSADLNAMGAAEIAAFDAAGALDGGTTMDAGAPHEAGAPIDGSLSADASTTTVGVVFDSATTATTGTVAIIIKGRITGIPSFMSATGALNRTSSGSPLATGVHDIPFRVALPTGTGNYHIVIYGHGTGGTYDENTFDQEITSGGAMKIATSFLGWTATSVVDTFGLFAQIMIGSDISTGRLTQSLADSMVMQHALSSSLGTMLAAPTLAGVSNPAAGRSPNLSQPLWAGGSLGGTMGYVYSAAEPSITAAVLNVPGAAWSQFVTGSTLFGIVKVIMKTNYPTDLDAWLGVATSQGNWDPVDGATWYDAVGDHHPLLLEQESIGDPVLPNIGNEMVAASSHADQVGVVLSPIVTCTQVAMASNHTGMSQFKVPITVTDALQIHGFAAGSSPAGIAAQQQIVAFVKSVWAGAPLIAIPPECASNVPENSCDFSAAQ